MDREEMLDCFRETAAILSRRRVTARVYIVGGAAMVLAYDCDRYTQDVDGLITRGYGELTEAVRQVARRRGLPESWLNQQASSAPGDDPRRRVVFDHPSLRVAAASPERMLAMKVLSARRVDVEDVKTLLGMLGFTSAGQVWEAFREVFPDQPIPEPSREMVSRLTGG